LLAGLDDTDCRSKCGVGNAPALADPTMAMAATGAPTIVMHVDMTQARPHGQML
jgi:hypothetical protein